MTKISMVIQIFFFLFSLNRKSYFPDVHGGVHGFGFAPQNQRPNPPENNAQNRFFGNSWGRGQRLGRD